MISIKENDEKKVHPHFKKMGYKNVLAMPIITKVTVNIGIGSLLKNEAASKEILKDILQDLTLIVGQKPVTTKARKSVATFGTRKGQDLGYKVTLRGKRMVDFLERLLNLALPRIRDFAGIPVASFDNQGNLTIGIKEHTVFPEVGTGKIAQKVKKIFGFEIIVTTSTTKREEGIALCRLLGFPLVVDEEKH